MNELTNIERYYRVAANGIFHHSSMNYDRVTDAIIKLSVAVHDYQGDTDDIWYIGEYTECCLSELIVGAFWHYVEWHAGQNSKGYNALSVLGEVFNPGATYPETDNEAYIMLNDMAA